MVTHLIEHGCLTRATLPIQDDSVVLVTAYQRLADEIEHVLPAEEHRRMGYGATDNVRVCDGWGLFHEQILWISLYFIVPQCTFLHNTWEQVSWKVQYE